jgi:hypothetical protein
MYGRKNGEQNTVTDVLKWMTVLETIVEIA